MCGDVLKQWALDAFTVLFIAGLILLPFIMDYLLRP